MTNQELQQARLAAMECAFHLNAMYWCEPGTPAHLTNATQAYAEFENLAKLLNYTIEGEQVQHPVSPPNLRVVDNDD